MSIDMVIENSELKSAYNRLLCRWRQVPGTLDHSQLSHRSLAQQQDSHFSTVDQTIADATTAELKDT